MEPAFVKPAVPIDDLAEFLARHHEATVADVEILKGGFWSSAYAYRAGEQHLVVRIGSNREWFEADKAAYQFASDALPIPRVLEVGEAFGRFYAISERRHGAFLEMAPTSSAEAVGGALLRLVDALRRTARPDAPTNWFTGEPGSWHDWLRFSLRDEPGRQMHGWHARLSQVPEAKGVFDAASEQIDRLLPGVPERRDLVHSDLLHGNVLMSEDWSVPTAVISWKCSARGDFLYDVAWCSIWSDWHPGIKEVHVFDRILNSSLFAEHLENAETRHLCYQLQIAASHLGWYIWTEDADNLGRLTRVLADVLRST